MAAQPGVIAEQGMHRDVLRPNQAGRLSGEIARGHSLNAELFFWASVR